MKISKETINSIPILIKEKKLTYQEALDILSVELLKNPKFFLGEIPDEEIKSELILRILQKGNFVLERYKEGYGIFSAYFTSFVKFQYLTLKRQKKSQMISEATYVIMQKTDYEAQLELYENQEYFKNKVSYEPYSLSEKNNFISKNNKKSLLEKNEKRIKNLKKTLLILTMKYINYINLDSLEEIALFCEIPLEKINEIRTTLLKNLNKKIVNRSELEKRRDKAFFLKRKYQIELDFLKSNNMNYEHKEYLLKRQTKFWNDKLIQLKKSNGLITPSNKQIAKELGMKERIISYYIKNAKNYIK